MTISAHFVAVKVLVHTESWISLTQAVLPNWSIHFGLFLVKISSDKVD